MAKCGIPQYCENLLYNLEYHNTASSDLNIKMKKIKTYSKNKETVPKILDISKGYSEPCQTFKTEHFVKIVKVF